MNETDANSGAATPMRLAIQKGRPGLASTLWTGLGWATGSWHLVAWLFVFDVLVSALVSLPGQAVILASLADRPTEALFGPGWHLEMLAEMVVVHRESFLAGAWLVAAGLLVSWSSWTLLWAGVALSWRRGRRDVASVLNGVVARGGRTLLVRMAATVPLLGVGLVVAKSLSWSHAAPFAIRVALLVPILVLLVLVHAVGTYWWIATAIGGEQDRWFVGSLARAWRASMSRSGQGIQVHLLYLVAWASLVWAAISALDPARTWLWPTWVLVVVVELCAVVRLWLYAGAVVSRGAILSGGEVFR